MSSEEAASNKIFIGFIALILRCKMYTALKGKARELIKKLDYLTVPAAIRELEKIEMTRQLDKVYRLDYAVTKTQKVILSAFDIDATKVKYKAIQSDELLKAIMVHLSYDVACEPEPWRLMHLSQLILREKNPELREALEDLDEFMNGY